MTSDLTSRTGKIQVGQHDIAFISHNEHLLEEESLVPLVFVHGLSMSVKFWELAMLPEIQAMRPWLSVSLPLHYPSTYAGQMASIDIGAAAYAKTLFAAVNDVYGNRKVRVVGHSVGALSALLFAIHYPQQCAGIFCIGGLSGGRAKGLQGMLRMLTKGRPFSQFVFSAFWGLKQRSIWFMRQVVKQYAADKGALSDYAPFEPTLRLVHPDLAKHDVLGLYRMICSLFEIDIKPQLAQISCESYIIAGILDPVVAFSHQQLLAELIPGAKLFPIEGAGHLSFAERPNQFNELLLAFAGSQSSTPA